MIKTSSGHNYYGKFVVKLNRNLSSNIEGAIRGSNPQDSSNMNKDLHYLYSNLRANSLNKTERRRDAKYQRKLAQDNYDAFAKTLQHIQHNTLTDYSYIISDFINFSPESKIEKYFS